MLCELINEGDFKMKPKEVKSILIAFNSTVGPWALKYPIGNKDLTETVKRLEVEEIIRHDVLTNF